MNVLAIDTATELCSAALRLGSRLIGREAELTRGHSERILAMVDEVLREGGVGLTALDGIGVGRGPGAFTGVRLAVSVAQGLAFGAGLPVAPISDLRALAQRVLESSAAASVVVCGDARMGEVYWACYRRDSGGLAELHGTERVTSPAEPAVPAELPRPVHAAGRGLRAYPELALRLGSVTEGLWDDLLPRAQEIAWLAATELAAGRGVPAAAALPQYLRDDVARPPSRK